jgi:hypothetical protein
MVSRAEVIQRVAEELALVPVGQAPEAQDKTRIGQAYDQQYARLKEKGLATWASTDDVPDKVVPHFELMILEKLLTRYSLPEARYLRIKTDAGPNGNVALADVAELVTEEYEDINGPEDF